ncbi:MAG: DUF4386 domain-containing protein [Chloroflexota bacterium]
MTNHNTEPSPQIYARAAGLLYLSIIPLGAFSLAYIPFYLVVAGDGAATASNIIASAPIVRLSIVAALVNQLVNIILVLVFYKLLKPASKTHASLMVVFFLVSAPITMFNELNNIAVVLLAEGGDYLTVFTPEQLHGLMLFFLELHEYGIKIATIFWGLWLFPMGYAIVKSGYMPKFVGILLIIACFGYLSDAFTALLLPDFGVTIEQFTFVGEVAVTLWLLFKGVDVEQWQKQALKLV